MHEVMKPTFLLYFAYVCLESFMGLGVGVISIRLIYYFFYLIHSLDLVWCACPMIIMCIDSLPAYE